MAGAARALGLIALVEILLAPRTASAWLFHEHAGISATAMKSLDAKDRATLGRAWALARETSREKERLCGSPVQEHAARAREAASREALLCVDYSALPALAGDHSCNPADLLRAIRTSTWVSKLLREVTRLESALEHKGGSILGRIDERRVHDITLQLVDREYLTRASAGGGHFQLTRNDGGERRGEENEKGNDVVLRRYLARALTTGQDTNATALYVNYHAAAIELAAVARLHCKDKEPLCADAAPFVWRALVTESFALHFLEDAFSSGHFVGTWGDVAQRLGTHDYYCQNGADAVTFQGETYGANGDLFLKDADLRRTSHAVATSLRQVLHELSAEELTELDLAALQHAIPTEDWNACTEARIAPGLDALAAAPFVEAAVREWPMPSMRIPEIPRFRAEVGLFFGASLTGDMALSASTSGIPVYEARVRPALRVGYGLEGAMSRYMDGRFFVELVGSGMVSSLDGEARLGVGIRAHIPFAVVPGDGLLGAGTAFGFQPSVWIARQAALGSVYGFERPLLLGEENTLQVTLGRDATFIVYPKTRSLTEHRYELLLSVLNMTIGRAYSQQVANEFGLELGFQMISSKGNDVDRTFGGYLSLSTGSRVYP